MLVPEVLFLFFVLFITIISGNTNGQNYELFGAVADARGIGVPLSYLLIQTTNEAAKGAKERVLTSWLNSIRNLGIYPEFILTDKDQSEINAVGHVWPNAKHQLCFWHALRAIKQRLVKTKALPAHYNTVMAHTIFNFIDPAFLPQAQRDKNDKVFFFVLNMIKNSVID